jgi:cyclopropane fatty-acyl-phospholipid synthase-like methyltransferase
VTQNTALPCAAASERNKDPILEQLQSHLPADADVLEIASGTGQHVAHFAAALPRTTWQPTDYQIENLVPIAARCDQAGLRNVQDPLRLDVHEVAWPVPDHFDALVCINMIHIAPWSATAALFAGARQVLREDGPRLVVLYGPFKEHGEHTAPSNEAFDASLKSRDPGWGVRDLGDVTRTAESCGFQRTAVERMPANNLLVVFAG